MRAYVTISSTFGLFPSRGFACFVVASDAKCSKGALISNTQRADISSLLPSSFSIPQQALQERAIRVLQQKKVYEAQIASLTQQNFNMESAAMTAENLRSTVVTVEAMKNANKQLSMEYGKVLCITV